MWTVTIRDTGVKDELIMAQVEFAQGDETIVRNLGDTTKAGLDQKIAKFKEKLEQRDAEKDLVTTGEWTEPTPEPEPEKTADELAQEEWLAEWKKYKGAKAGMKELADAGVTPSTEEQAAFNALKTWVADNRKPEYTHLIANDV